MYGRRLGIHRKSLLDSKKDLYYLCNHPCSPVVEETVEEDKLQGRYNS